MKILVLGSGGREHAIVRALARESPAPELHAAPGNPGIAALATCHAVPATQVQAVVALARDLAVDLVMVGPEAPLVAGVVDALNAAGIPAFGPTAAAARLEGSKAFAKEIMQAAGVPTARSVLVTDPAQARAALADVSADGTTAYVCKADGLAAGKGVVVTGDLDEAVAHVETCLEKADSRVVVEEFLEGPEVSLFCLSDGATVVPLAPAQDFKRARDGDEGPNTGGMGAYSPVPVAWDGLEDEVVATVAQPVVDEMARRGTPFAGVLYCGLALTPVGVRVIEFNARFGDPETQVVLPRLTTPLSALALACTQGTLGEQGPLSWSGGAAVTAVLASEGYPARPRLGDEITGVVDAEVAGAAVLQAGTTLDADGALVSAGGRVLATVGTGPTLADARNAAYAGIERIRLRGGHFRRDIAERAAKLESQQMALFGPEERAAARDEDDPDAVATGPATEPVDTEPMDPPDTSAMDPTDTDPSATAPMDPTDTAPMDPTRDDS